jgi:beta-N-acetylhexosaminidase
VRRSTIVILTCAAIVFAVVGFVAAGAGIQNGGSSQAGSAGQHGANTTAAAGAAGLTAVSPGIGLRPGSPSPVAAGYPAAQAAIPRLSVLQLAGQRVIYSYGGMTPPAGLLWLIRHGEAAGVIFFTENIGTTAADLANFRNVVRELRQAAASPLNPVHEPLLLMTDQEGGIVRRLPGAPALSAKQVGLAAHPQRAATQAGAGAGANLHGFGLNVNLAPVLDVYRQPGNFIDQFGRSFSNRPGKVAKLGQLYATAEQGKGVAATVKHFPGLGAAARGQNTDLGPVTLNLPLSQIRTVDEVPYTTAIGAKVKLVMVSWAVYPALDATHPAGLSRRIVQGELRRRLGFAGVTITDALEAGALKPFRSIAHRSVLAAGAGMDLLLCAARNYREGDAALHALAAAYSAGTPGEQAAFRAAAERVIALRASLAG